MLDLGANVGDVTKAALDVGLKVVAIEPDPSALRRLTERFGAHPDVEIIPAAVGASNRTSSFHRVTDNETAGDWTTASSLFKTAEHETSIVVNVVDIVPLIREKRPTLVKMDIEGAEVECLEAIMNEGLHLNGTFYLVETHERFSPEIASGIQRIRQRLIKQPTTSVNLDWV